MRVSRIKITNFQGIKELDLDGLESLPLVVISGRNGTGKSTVLMAISLVWDTPSELDAYSLVGPWGEKAHVEIYLSLTFDERAILGETVRAKDESEGECPEVLCLGIIMEEYGRIKQLNTSNWASTLRSKNFRRVNSFARLTLIPSERSIGRSNLGYVSPDGLSMETTESIRTDAINSVVNRWSNFSMNSIPDYLATLDYAAMISSRQGDGGMAISEYDDITASFLEATGKQIEKPSLSREGKVAIFVDGFNGNRHSIEHLSSGELQALGLMYLARRLAAAGGVLLVDEPEVHLHPSLQTTILEMMRGASESAQLWLCTHSPNLINSSPVESIISISRAREGANQGTRIGGLDTRLELLSDLGVTPSSWLQHDRIIIVEGATDKRFLELLFPVEVSRSLIYIAGSRVGVDATVRTLTDGVPLLPWVAIRDRDLVGNIQGESEGSFTWQRRTFENSFLDPELLTYVINLAGGETVATEVECQLRDIAYSERAEVEYLLTEEKLREIVPNTKPLVKEDLKASLENQISLQQARIDAYDEAARQVAEYLDENWTNSWKSLVQGKRVLANFTRYTPFRSMANMVSAICKTCRECPELIPEDVQRLHRVITGAEH